MQRHRCVLVSLVALLFVAGAAADPARAEDEPPGLGSMRFSKSADAFPEDEPAVFAGEDTIYALVSFGRRWRELMRRADKGTSAVIKLYEGRTQRRSATFKPGEASFGKDTFVLEVVPDPTTATQFPYFIVDTLAKLAVGRHELMVELWSFDAATKDKILARGTFSFVATEAGRGQLADRAAAIKEAWKRHRASERRSAPSEPPPPAPDTPKPEAPQPDVPEPDTPEEPPTPTAVKVRRGGADFLQLRGDEIVKDGAIVGRFDGARVRKGGSIVGEIRGTVFRHEGSEKWRLDSGNLYSGTEIRWEGAIIGSIEGSGRITWEGSEWGSVRPYEGSPEETMRIFAALYYFSDYFRRK